MRVPRCAGFLFLLVLAAISLAACEEGGGMLMPPSSLSFINYETEICAWQTTCGDSARDCFSLLHDHDTIYDREAALRVYEKRLACLKLAKTCPDFEACMSDYYPDRTGRCSDLAKSTSASGPFCVGNTLRGCAAFSDGTPLAYEQNCAARGLVCKNGICGSNAKTCAESYEQESCHGNVALWCMETLARDENPSLVWDCAALGGTCGNRCAGMPEGTCEYDNVYGCIAKNSKSCKAEACEGSKIVPCFNGKTGFKLDCRLYDPRFTCILMDDDGDLRASCHLPPDNQECNEKLADTGASFSCDGNKGRLCVAGEWVTIDCAAIGATCTIEGKYTRGCTFPK